MKLAKPHCWGLGPLELRLMELLWRNSSLTVREARERLPKPLRGAYTTVMTTMARLYRMGLLRRHRQGLSYVYEPRSNRDEFAQSYATAVLRELMTASTLPTIRAIADTVRKAFRSPRG